MAITMGAVFQLLEKLDPKLGEILEYDGNYDAASGGDRAEDDASNVCHCIGFHLVQLGNFMMYLAEEDVSEKDTESEAYKMHQLRVADSGASITRSISQFDDPPSEEDEEGDEPDSENEEA
jgi:hypothetical protein